MHLLTRGRGTRLGSLLLGLLRMDLTDGSFLPPSKSYLGRVLPLPRRLRWASLQTDMWNTSDIPSGVLLQKNPLLASHFKLKQSDRGFERDESNPIHSPCAWSCCPLTLCEAYLRVLSAPQAHLQSPNLCHQPGQHWLQHQGDHPEELGPPHH